MDEIVPETGARFEAMMREIDAGFINDGVPIPARPMKAVMAVGSRYKLSIPFTKLVPGAPPELQRYAQLSKSIHDWFERLYGDRLKIDFAVGQMIVLIKGDLYELRLPRIYGQVQFTLSRDFISAPKISSSGSVISNILQLVTDLTPAKAATLSDDDLILLGKDFDLGLRSLSVLDANQGQELIQIAKGDVQTAVRNLLDRSNRFGESKWASLQAAEKALKAAISLEGANFKYSHQLAGLCKQLDTLGITFAWKPAISVIQCAPGIRYGEEKCSREEALSAHHASLQLVLALLDGGAKFKRGIA